MANFFVYAYVIPAFFFLKARSTIDIQTEITAGLCMVSITKYIAGVDIVRSQLNRFDRRYELIHIISIVRSN